jgi:hypothetical protein
VCCILAPDSQRQCMVCVHVDCGERRECLHMASMYASRVPVRARGGCVRGWSDRAAAVLGRSAARTEACTAHVTKRTLWYSASMLTGCQVVDMSRHELRLSCQMWTLSPMLTLQESPRRCNGQTSGGQAVAFQATCAGVGGLTCSGCTVLHACLVAPDGTSLALSLHNAFPCPNFTTQRNGWWRLPLPSHIRGHLMPVNFMSSRPVNAVQ